jgi:hypothetical protein
VPESCTARQVLISKSFHGSFCEKWAFQEVGNKTCTLNVKPGYSHSSPGQASLSANIPAMGWICVTGSR